MLPGPDDTEDETFECNAAGINHRGLTGDHRQETISSLAPGQKVILVRHVNNEHDENAVALFTESGKDIGYLPAHVAEEIAPILDGGRAVTARVTGVEEFVSTGNNRLLGVRLELTSWKRKRKRANRKPARTAR